MDGAALFKIEGFFRSRSDFRAVLEIDEIITQNDLPDPEKMAAVQALIQKTIQRIEGKSA